MDTLIGIRHADDVVRFVLLKQQGCLVYQAIDDTGRKYDLNIVVCTQKVFDSGNLTIEANAFSNHYWPVIQALRTANADLTGEYFVFGYINVQSKLTDSQSVDHYGNVRFLNLGYSTGNPRHYVYVKFDDDGNPTFKTSSATGYTEMITSYTAPYETPGPLVVTLEHITGLLSDPIYTLKVACTNSLQSSYAFEHKFGIVGNSFSIDITNDVISGSTARPEIVTAVYNMNLASLLKVYNWMQNKVSADMTARTQISELSDEVEDVKQDISTLIGTVTNRFVSR